jgi:hypothetical protein
MVAGRYADVGNVLSPIDVRRLLMARLDITRGTISHRNVPRGLYCLFSPPLLRASSTWQAGVRTRSLRWLHRSTEEKEAYDQKYSIDEADENLECS